MQKKIPIKFIKYEDLQNQTYYVFKEVIKFINKITNNKEKINTDKIKTVLKTTSFEKLKKNEIDHGFSEAVISKEDKNKKIPFFNLGPKNDWREIISDNLKVKLESIFEKDLKELSY
jgi:Glu-tRNA(Gln) amidotransferase subunit E-like FAD-binding protein